jgi:TolB protein
MRRATALLATLGALCLGATWDNARAAQPPLLLFVSNHETKETIYQTSPSGANLRPFRNSLSSESLPAWSPDGTRVSFCTNMGGNHDIFVMDANGSNQRRLTDDPANDLVTAWSPDSKRIAFTSTRAGNPEIFVMDADGSNVKNITNRAGPDTDPAWSPDGQQILFSSQRDDLGWRLYSMNPDGENVRMLPAKQTGMGGVFPAWSPDGSRIAFTDAVGNGTEIFTCNRAGSDRQQITTTGGHNMFPAWSPDGKLLAYQHWDKVKEPGSVYVRNLDTGIVTFIAQSGSWLVGRPAWRPQK